MKIVILTGSQLRHQYFRKRLALEPDIEVLASFCESNNVLAKMVKDCSPLAEEHLRVRELSERDCFEEFVNFTIDKSNPKQIEAGQINSQSIIDEIASLSPDLIISYGCSIIRGELLNIFHGRFVNLHLGLSPYYMGSGTNYWPFVNREPQYCGVTFMHIDAGVDTGEIIHQIQADYGVSDHPVVVGNRLIVKMTRVCAQLVNNYDQLESKPQLNADGKVYRNKDFTDESVKAYYRVFSDSVRSLVDAVDNVADVKPSLKLIQQEILEK